MATIRLGVTPSYYLLISRDGECWSWAVNLDTVTTTERTAVEPIYAELNPDLIPVPSETRVLVDLDLPNGVYLLTVARGSHRVQRLTAQLVTAQKRQTLQALADRLLAEYDAQLERDRLPDEDKPPLGEERR